MIKYKGKEVVRMGAIDTEAKAYLSDPAKVADAFNYWMYNGRDIIKATELEPLDTTAIALPYGNDARQPIQKIRDVLKLYTAMMDNQAYYLLLGIEIQAAIHYGMPVRNMLYDAMGYAQQISNLAAAYSKSEEKLKGAEFLSGLRKGDKLKPIVTLVISLSPDPWDGPTNLHEMLAAGNKEILSYVPDYKLNLLSPAQIAEEDFSKFRTGLGAVMQFIKHRKDKSMDWMDGNERFKRMDRDTANLIKTTTGADIQFGEKEDVVDMWVAWENSMKQARLDGEMAGKQAGLNEGRSAGRNEGQLDMMTAIRMIKEDKTSEAICEATGLSNQRLAELKAML